MDLVIIKIYRNEISCNDYSDIMIDDYEEKVQELHKYGQKIGKKILFHIYNSSVSCDNFAEITTDFNLTEQEKNYFIETIKFFCGDATITRQTMHIEVIPLTIIFNQANTKEIMNIN